MKVTQPPPGIAYPCDIPGCLKDGSCGMEPPLYPRVAHYCADHVPASFWPVKTGRAA